MEYIATRNGARTNIKIFQYSDSAIVVSATLPHDSHPLGFVGSSFNKELCIRLSGAEQKNIHET